MFFGTTLKKIRKNRGLTQEELASNLGITKQTIINYEKNRTKPNEEAIKEIALILNVTPNMLLSPEISGNVDYSNTREAYMEEYKLFLIMIQKLKKEEESMLHNFFLESLDKFTNKELFQIVDNHYLEIFQLLDKKEALQKVSNELDSLEPFLDDKTSLFDFEPNNF